MYIGKFLLLGLLLSGLEAQQRDIGLLGGGGFLHNVGIRGSGGATAGFSPGFATGVVLGQDLYQHWSGEIRYLFEKRDARLRNGGAVSEFSGQAHVVHYDLIFHATPRSSRVRPYLAVGGGVKVFRGTGAEMAYRPLMEFAYLTRTNQLKPLFVAGGGIKFLLRENVMARIDFRDQVTGFPGKVISPAPGMAIGGALHDFVPLVGISWIF